jgi:hypothetical protein
MTLRDKVDEKLLATYQLAEKLHLSVDTRKDKPFHCDSCGESHQACKHWFSDSE